MLSEKAKSKLSYLPEQPGVYLMYDKDSVVLYIGKALILKNRIKSYFSGTPDDNKTLHLVSNIHNFEYIITNTEQEAFLLEANLIKQHQPRYNILLKDDKKYPHLKITVQESFPRIEITRDIIKDGSQYFGPYTDVRYMRRLIRELEWIFPHRTCKKNIPENEIIYKRACLNLQLGKCPAPCIGNISKTDYLAIISKISKYLIGKNDDLIKEMRLEMETFAERLEFEKASKVRDKIAYIESIYKKQVIYFSDFQDRDIIAFYREEKHIAVTLLKMLSGKISNKETFSFKNTNNESTESVLRAFLLQYYANTMNSLPYQILIQIKPEEFDSLNILFNKKLIIPARGEYKKLIEIARKNAFDFIENIKLSNLKKSNRTVVPIQELKEFLNLKKLPRKMICIDISTIQGSETVSSLVFFENGKPLKKQYRHFIIKSVEGQNDFASIAETMDRYLNHLLTDNSWEIPDLIIIDGGKGQLSSSQKVLESHQSLNENFASIELVSLAKRVEEVFTLFQSESIIIPKTSPALKVLTHIRDEAHRFAITHHRKRRSNRTLSSKLDNVKGLGENKKFLLLKTFGSVENISKMDKTELVKIKGIGEKLAENILNELN